MAQSSQPTPYDDVNQVLRTFHTEIHAILGRQFVGMYIYGSLALGDFNPKSSDIDFIVISDGDIDDPLFETLAQFHNKFNASGSAWANKVEAIYVSLDALESVEATAARYPQIEKGKLLVREPLEVAWIFQRHILRERAIVISGPKPSSLMSPVNPEDMRWAIVAMTGEWLELARYDHEWLEWVGQREGQAFVVLMLCRCLYALATGDVASKSMAARWAQHNLPPRWKPLIGLSLVRQHEQSRTAESDVIDTLYFIEYTYQVSQQ
ncbi:MAG: DUF4111 domain-containing protein [Anaerolineae bacterium]